MIKINKMWKTIVTKKKFKRHINEVEYNSINLSDYIIIDVRNRREFKEKHINGAINIPFPEVKKNIEKYIKNKNNKILIYCQSGIRSKKAVGIVEELGYKEVYNLKGGLENI